MQTRTIGPVTVSAIGLGGMPMSSEAELRHCAEAGIAFLPWSPLGGIGRAGQLGSRHAAFGEIAAARGVSPQRVTLAWMLASAGVDHRLGTGAELALTPGELARLDASRS